MKIMVATPCGGGMVHWKYHLSVTTELFLAEDRLLDQQRYNLAQWTQGGYSGLSKDRGVTASFALMNGFDKLLFIDSDQSWKWWQAKAILDSDKPIIAGMVPLKAYLSEYRTQLNFTALKDDRHFYDQEDGMVTVRGVERWRKAHPGQDEMQVDALGTGFVCIDVKILAKMVNEGVVEKFGFPVVKDGVRSKTPAWDFFATGPLNNHYYGEDHGFCLNAARVGASCWVNTRVEIPHHGLHEYHCGSGLNTADAFPAIAAHQADELAPRAAEQMEMPFPPSGAV
jgi:hypothetical protein